MATRLSQYFSVRRQQKGFKPGQLARLVGYKNVSGGANKICRFEMTGEVRKDLLLKLADVLDIDRETMTELIEEDRAESLADWNRWADEPIEPYLVIRFMPAVYGNRKLPEECDSRADAEVYAAGLARQMHRRVCLVLSRRLSVWFNEAGGRVGVTQAQSGEANVPASMLAVRMKTEE